ncbi:hypothetical protein [Streptomyces sp. NRRL S-37]|uniref:hypothetical protein n=1 Tax=Streptomyces sp. NRRL S-37 TaxID=1463903 RepID=UPI0004C6456C|nr:hypothetical protein [Streptomyces sp. NRRL S-37]
MTDDSQKVPLGEHIKGAGVLAGFVVWALTVGVAGLVILGFLLLILFIVGFVLYAAWQASATLGLILTLPVLYVVLVTATGQKF